MNVAFKEPARPARSLDSIAEALLLSKRSAPESKVLVVSPTKVVFGEPIHGNGKAAPPGRRPSA